jgi:hypothetical protein
VVVVPPAAAPAVLPARLERDRTIDLLRAGCVLVVLAWHVLGNLIVWRSDGPHATNPVGEVPLAWLATWFLQVLPLFFVVGGWAHRSALAAAEDGRAYVRTRLRSLTGALVPVLGVAATAWLVGSGLTGGAPWVTRSIVLLLMPLWFLAVYLVLVVALPLTAALDRRWGWWALGPWALAAVVADVHRFRSAATLPGALVSFVAVYGFAHQLGFRWGRLRELPCRRGWFLAAAGAGALVVLTGHGYPRSMVGEPGAPVSNLAPPTVCVVALCLLQVGLALVARPALERRLTRGGRLAEAAGWMNRNAMAVYLWHPLGCGLVVGAVVLLGLPVSERFDIAGWLQRPLWASASLLATAALVRASRPSPRAASGRA